MLVTTTHSVEGSEIVGYKGVVFSETIMGTNVFRDIFASFRNFFGGRTRGYEKEMEKAREEVLERLVDHASNKGANAVVGLDVDYQLVQAGGKGAGDLIVIAATGTAVRIEEIHPR